MFSLDSYLPLRRFRLDEVSDWSEEREDALRTDVKARLYGVCGEWSREEYDAVVEKIVRSTIRSLYATMPRPPL